MKTPEFEKLKLAHPNQVDVIKAIEEFYKSYQEKLEKFRLAVEAVQQSFTKEKSAQVDLLLKNAHVAHNEAYEALHYYDIAAQHLKKMVSFVIQLTITI